MKKAVIISDIHIGRYKYGRVDEKTGIDTRTLDILSNIDKSIDYAINNRCDSFLILGDFYHTKRPLTLFRKLLIDKLKRVLKSGMDLYLLLGNHDQSKTISHDLIELKELDGLVNNLHVIDEPLRMSSGSCDLFFLPHVNKVEFNLADHQYYDYNTDQIKEFTTMAEKSDLKYKFFFGHFGTDKSKLGNSMDLGMVAGDKSRIVPVNIFDKKVWTHVFLGDIHLPHDINSLCTHIGSIAKVDFGEENEEKGFVVLETGEQFKYEFIPVEDREFKTLYLDLLDNPRESMTEFCEEIQSMDLSELIIRLKVRINANDKGLISFDGIEEYLKEESYFYVNKSVEEMSSETSVIMNENQDLDYSHAFLDYIKQIKSTVNEDIFEDVMAYGVKILSNNIQQS